MRCIYCGFENEQAVKNCVNCGRSISTIVSSAPGSLAAILASGENQPAPPNLSTNEPEPFKFTQNAATPPPETFTRGAATPPPEDNLEISLPNWMAEKPTPPPMPATSYEITQAKLNNNPQNNFSKAVSLEELGVFNTPVAPTVPVAPVAPVENVEQAKKNKPKPEPKKTGVTPNNQQDNLYLTSKEFVCPRCKKVRETQGSVMVTDGNASRLVCYQCAREVHNSERVLTKARASDWIPAFLSGLVMAVICGGLIYGLTFLLPQVWLVGLALVGIFVGSAVRMGANNHSGFSLTLIALLLTIVGYGVCAYANIMALYGGRWLSWADFNGYFNRISLSYLEWGSAVVGILLATVVTLEWGKN
jgi:hypothetical protein